MENAVQSVGAGGIVMTVWTPASELTMQEWEELHTYLLKRWGASFVGSLGSGR
jgi:hypothetical protein